MYNISASQDIVIESTGWRLCYIQLLIYYYGASLLDMLWLDGKAVIIDNASINLQHIIAQISSQA